MFNDVMQIDAKYLIDFIKPLVAVVILSLIIKFFRYNDSADLNFPDIIINMLKMTAYGFLACYIYLKVKISNSTEIDVLTFFTFLLASLESVHSFINSLGTYFVALIRVIFNFDKPFKY